MTEKIINREKVKEFFSWQWPTKDPDLLKSGWGLLIVGAIIVAFASIFGIIPFGIGAAMIYTYNKEVDLTNTPIIANLPYLHDVKYHDIVKIWLRSYTKIDKPLEELSQFDIKDYNPLGGTDVDFESLTNSQDTLTQIAERSVFILGPTENPKLQIAASHNDVTIEYNPINISVLYIAGSQLIVYNSVIDIEKGDLNSETVQRLYLNEIVEVSVKTTSNRISLRENEGLLKKYNEVRSIETNELIRSSTIIFLTKTDGRTLDFPIGTPNIRDGLKGELDSDEISENRDMRIATALQQNIEKAKQLMSN